MRTLRVLKTSTLSVVSAITLSIRSGCLSLTDRAPESSLRLSQWTPVPRWLLSGLHANYCNQTQVFLILHLTHLLTAVSRVFLPLQTSLNHAPPRHNYPLHILFVRDMIYSSVSQFQSSLLFPSFMRDPSPSKIRSVSHLSGVRSCVCSDVCMSLSPASPNPRLSSM